MLERNYGLDILRIMLALSVIVFHYSFCWSCAGSVAVDGFFVLCGFCSVISLRGKTDVGSLGSFYRKKAWRLLPLPLILWLLSVVYHRSIVFPDPGQLILSPTRETVRIMRSAPTWFVPCVLIFFVVFPFLAKLRNKQVFCWIGLALFFFALWQSLHYPFAACDSGGMYYHVSFRMWQFLLGMWCASWNTEHWNIVLRIFLIVAGFGHLLASSLISRCGIGFLNYSFPFYVLSSGIFALAFASLQHTPLSTISVQWRKRLAILSGMTYALFLFHSPVGNFVHSLGMSCMGMESIAASLFSRGCALVLTFLLAYILYQVVEIRIVGRILKRNPTP